MSRKERHRQEKIARVQGAGQSGSSPDYALQMAGQYFQSGQLDQAVKVLEGAVWQNPGHFDVTYGLAVIHATRGDPDSALPLFKKAVLIRPGDGEAQFNLGLTLAEKGRPVEASAAYRRCLEINPREEGALINLGNALKDTDDFPSAADCFRRALKINPNNAMVHANLGNVLVEQERLEDAVSSYREALGLNPGLAETHASLGCALKTLGRLEEAVNSHQQALALKPNFAEAHNNLGIALQDLGRAEEACDSYQKAIALKPDYAEAYNNLGNVLREQGQVEEAISSYRIAITIDPLNDFFWAGLAASLKTHSFTSIDELLLTDLLRLLDWSMILTQPIINALRHYPDFSKILEQSASAKLETGMAYGDIAEQLSAIPLFLRIIELSLIHDLEIERMLTFLRRAMIEETVAGEINEKSLAFSVALALQCFVNEYIFSETDEEKAAVEILQQRIATLVEKELDVPPSLIFTLGAYRPLYGFSWARELSERKWAGDIGQVIEQQILEPLEERSLRSQIPRLTPIENAVSQSVRKQNEEYPYPRWVKIGIGGVKSQNIGAVLQEAPLHLDLGDYQSPESPDILVAGCGTGQHSLVTATRFSNARVLAVDLSLSSLSYALRKTQELDVSNIEYAQADIIELGSLGRQFDLIESVGVLHHLGDPLAGWRVLVDLLRPGGLMKIGL